MGTLNENGYQVTTLAEKRTAMVTVFRAAFGDTIRTDSESAQGQIIDYFVGLVDNEDKVGLAFFNQQNYRLATGLSLSLIAISKGQPRRSGTSAVIDCTFTSSAIPYVIPANSVFSDTANNLEFTNTAAINISSLTQTVQLIARNNGITNLIATNTLTAQSYFPSLTNIEITANQDGTDNETDSQLIARLSESDSESGTNDVEAIADRLNRLDDTSRVTVLENDTDATVDTLPPHSIEALVLGGLDASIAEVIFNTKASGTPTSGTTAITVVDSQGFDRIINFTRPALIDIYVRIRLTSREGAPISGNIEQLRLDTMSYVNNLRVGQDVSRTPVFGIWGDGTFDINQVSLSTDGTTYVDTNIAIATRQYGFVMNLNQIIVENV